MDEDFLANAPSEGKVGEDAFLSDDANTGESQKETVSDPPAEKKPEQADASQGADNTPDAKIEPFHKHPRWIKTQEELNELRKFRDEVTPKLSTYEEVIAKLGKPAESNIPDWFPKSGNAQADTQKYQEYLNYENGVKAQIKQELLAEQTKEAQAKTAEEKKWTDWVENSIQELTDEGLKFDKNELQSIALKYLPSDEQGNIDFRKAYEIMTELNKYKAAPLAQKADARKKIGDLATSGPQRAESAKSKVQSNRSLRNASWDSLVRETN